MIDIIVNNILPFVIILTILVFVHELGHYVAAIKNGVRVETFSVGFGKVSRIKNYSGQNRTVSTG